MADKSFLSQIINKQVIKIYSLAVASMMEVIYAIVFTELAFSILILEIAFDRNTLAKTIKIIYFHVLLSRLYGDYDKVYVAKAHIKHQHYLLSLSIKYERIKTYYGLSLDSNMFEKMDVQLSKQWDEYINKVCGNNEKMKVED